MQTQTVTSAIPIAPPASPQRKKARSRRQHQSRVLKPAIINSRH